MRREERLGVPGGFVDIAVDHRGIVGREKKKISFSAPGTCPIDLFGSLANGRAVKQLHLRLLFVLVSYIPLAAKDYPPRRSSRCAAVLTVWPLQEATHRNHGRSPRTAAEDGEG